MTPTPTISLEEFFAGAPDARALHQAVADMVAGLGGADQRVTKSQVAFRRRRGFAYTWRPGQYVRSDVPLVLSLALPERVDSPRFASVVHPAPHVWMHHLELTDVAQLDDEVRGLLARAWAASM